MMRNWRICLACLHGALLACVSLPAAADGPARVLTTELPPFTMQSEPAMPGALLEIVDELLRRTRTESTIEFVPWRRAILLTATGRRTAIFPLSRTPERETQYRWLVRLYYERFVFLSARGRSFDVAAPELETRRRIGVLRGSAAGGVLHGLGYANIVEAGSIDEELRFLKRGIVDAVFGESAIYHHILKDGIGDTYLLSVPQYSVTTWLGGSLDFSAADAALFAKARKEMVDDGSFDRILKKYGLPNAP